MNIAMYDLEGHLLETFEVKNIQELVKILNSRLIYKLSHSQIGKCLTGHYNYADKRQFREFDKKALDKIGDVSGHKMGSKVNPVHKFYQGKYINTYKNVYQASLKTDVNESTIHKCCEGEQKTAGGFEWQYAN